MKDPREQLIEDEEEEKKADRAFKPAKSEGIGFSANLC
jgi:hypothetical protein